MADNYQLFSQMIPYSSPEERDWLLDALDPAKWEEDDNGRPCDFDDQPTRAQPGVWVYSDYYGNLEGLADVVQRFQETFQKTEPWSIEWADTCSKPRLEEFSGGGLLVYKGEQYWFSPWQMIQDKIKELDAEDG